MRPLDAYHGNHHTFWPRLYSVRGRHSSGLSDSTDAKAMDCRPEAPSASSIGVGSDGRAADAGVGSPPSPSGPIPASIFEVASPVGREAAKERARQ